MGLGQALSNAYSGLSASSRQAEVAAYNIANSTTPGFLRRSVELEAQSVAGQGMGVRVEGVSLATSRLTADRREAEADFAYQDVIAGSASSLAQIIGDPDDPGSLFTRYQQLEDSLALLAETPDSEQLQLDAFNRATDLATEFNTANERLLELRANVDREIAQQVEAFNELLAEFDKVNDSIEEFHHRGEEIAELEAQRQGLIDKITKYVPVTILDRPGERVALMSQNGFTLIDSDPPTITFTPANAVDPTMDFIGGAPGALSGLEVNGVDRTPPAANGNPFGGGALGALFEVRDVATVDFQTAIDALARDLIDRFDDAAVDPTLTPGNPGLFTDAQGADSGVAGLAARLEVNDAVDPNAAGGDLWRLRDGMEAVAQGDSGDNTILVGMLGALTTATAAPAGSGVSGTLDAAELAAQFGSKYATASFAADETLALRASRVDSLSREELSETGVDVDYELQNLNLIQTAYSANARVMQVVDEMLQRLMEI